MSRRNRSKLVSRAEAREPCSVCGGTNRPSGNGCWDCYWDDWPECRAEPEKDVRPNYLSFIEATFIFRVAGAEAVKTANTAGPKGAMLRARYRDLMKQEGEFQK